MGKRNSTYDKVLDILKKHPVTLSSDKALVWRYAVNHYGHLFSQGTQLMPWEVFKMMPSGESITRARRKALELNPDLQSQVDPKVRAKRSLIATKKGNHVFHS
jgi:hypothetical protein